jgi:hypothetical protein
MVCRSLINPSPKLTQCLHTDDIDLPNSQQGDVGLIYGLDPDAPPLRTVSCVSKWIRKYGQDAASSNNTQSGSVPIVTAAPQNNPLTASQLSHSNLGVVQSNKLPHAAVTSQKSHPSILHPSLSNKDTKTSGNKPFAGGAGSRDANPLPRYPQLSSLTSQSFVDLQSRAIKDMPKFNALVRSSDRSNAKRKRMNQREEIDELKQIVDTGYKGHFPWVLKPWNIGGKIVKTQCFTSLYQL